MRRVAIMAEKGSDMSMLESRTTGFEFGRVEEHGEADVGGLVLVKQGAGVQSYGQEATDVTVGYVSGTKREERVDETYGMLLRWMRSYERGNLAGSMPPHG